MTEQDSFTVSQLAVRSGVSVASIKFYLREGLLPPPVLERPHRAYYGKQHLDRIRLILALKDVANLSLSAIQQVVAALDVKKAPTLRIIADTLNSVAEGERRSERETADPGLRSTMRHVDAFLKAHEVTVHRGNISRLELGKALHAIQTIHGSEVPVEALSPYLEAATYIARVETNAEILRGDPEHALRHAVLGTLLWERVLVHLRRIMHEHFARQVLSGTREKGGEVAVGPRTGAPRDESLRGGGGAG